MPRTQLASSGKQSGGSSSSATPSSGSQRIRRSKPNSTSGGSPAQTAVKPHPDKDEPRQQERTGGGRNGGSTKHIPCKFFKHGNCTAGEDCTFSHDVNLFVEKSVCKYFVKGNCKYGNRCALLHSAISSGSGGSHPPSSSSSSLKQNGRSRLRRNTVSEDDVIETVNSDTESNSDEIQTCKSSSDGMATGGEEESTSSTYTSGGGTSSMGLLAASLLTSGGNNKNSRRNGAAATDKAATARGSGSNKTKSFSGNKNAIPIPPKVHVNSWATGSGANLFHKEASSPANQKTSMASSKHKNIQSQHDDSNPVSPFRTTFDNEPQRKSQPIPGARSNKNNDGGSGLGIHREEEGEDEDDDDAGFSTTQASQRIDRLALSNSGVKQSSFAGSPFLGSSIPLLDHFKELSNGGNESGGYNSSDNTPLTAHSLTRSPQLGSTSGNLLTRHAFTAIDNPAAGGNTRGLGSNSSRIMGLPPNTASMHLDLSSPMMHPIGGGSPRSYHDFSNSMFSPGVSNEPISPRNMMATTRLRSNSHLSSPQNIGFPPTASLDIRGNNNGYSGSLHDSPFLAADNQQRGKGFSLMDIHSLSPFGQPTASSLSASMDSNNWLRGSMPQPVGSSHGHGLMGQSPRMSRHLSEEDGHDYHQQLSMPTSLLGPVGQQRPSYKNHIGDLGYEAGMFELEDQDSNGSSTVGSQQQKQNIAPTPSFISVEGFAQKFSGMSMKK